MGLTLIVPVPTKPKPIVEEVRTVLPSDRTPPQDVTPSAPARSARVQDVRKLDEMDGGLSSTEERELLLPCCCYAAGLPRHRRTRRVTSVQRIPSVGVSHEDAQPQPADIPPESKKEYDDDNSVDDPSVEPAAVWIMV